MITSTPRRVLEITPGWGWGGGGGGEGKGRSQKPKFYKESMNQNWSFQRDGRGVDSNPKSAPWLGCGYFLEQHINASCFSVVVQNRVVAIWFKGKELAFAFGCFLAVSRLVSSLLLFSSIAAPFKSLDLCL